MRQRRTSRAAAVHATPVTEPDPSELLRFDFAEERDAQRRPAPQRDASIKQAIIRWLNEQM